MEVQVATPLLPLRPQVVNEPDRVLVNVIVPVGVIFVPELVSETVMEHVVGVPAIIEVGEQLMEVEVVRCDTVRLVEPMTPLIQFELDRV